MWNFNDDNNRNNNKTTRLTSKFIMTGYSSFKILT